MWLSGSSVALSVRRGDSSWKHRSARLHLVSCSVEWSAVHAYRVFIRSTNNSWFFSSTNDQLLVSSPIYQLFTLIQVNQLLNRSSDQLFIVSWSDQLIVTCVRDAATGAVVRAAGLRRGLGPEILRPRPTSSLPPREDWRRHHAQQQPHHDQLRQVLRRQRRMFPGGERFQKWVPSLKFKISL